VEDSPGPQYWSLLEFLAPYTGRCGFFFCNLEAFDPADLESVKLLSETLDCVVIITVGRSSSSASGIGAKRVEEAVVSNDKVLILEPSWTASLLGEGKSLGVSPRGWVTQPFLPELQIEGAVSSRGVTIESSQSDYQATEVMAFPTARSVSEKLRQIEETPAVAGKILYCSTFLHPVTFSQAAVSRFYRSIGTPEELLPLIARKTELERKKWLEHANNYQRTDVYDLQAVTDYFRNPEYYQMRLVKEELNEQVENFVSILWHENYTVAFTTEAVNLPFEIRGKRVRLRADRREKAPPKMPRVASIGFDSRVIAEALQSEFFALFGASEPKYRDKSYIEGWVKELAEAYAGVAEPAP
jgi:hypothetical protein